MAFLKNKFWIVQTIIFLLLFVWAFMQISYLFRPISVNRRNVVGYYAEEPDSIDVVLIGGSSTYVFWAPYTAWNECGIVSYDFSTDSMSPALLKGMIEEAQKTQNPELYVIDLRALEVREKHEGFYSEAYLRNVTDSFKYSANRNDIVNYSFGAEQPQKQQDPAVYLDFMMYHSNWQNLSAENFKYVGNAVPTKYKGFDFVTFAFYSNLPTNDYSHVTECSGLSEETNKILIDLLEYCRENDIPAVFTLNPFYMEDESIHKMYNYVGKIVNEYGYEFVNTNNYYNDMGIDFGHDFYNRDHVNLYGAEKYTKFLAQYLVQNYDISDRREDLRYSEQWNAGYVEWEKAVQEHKVLIDNAIAAENAAK